jgi:hypothetical protein
MANTIGELRRETLCKLAQDAAIAALQHASSLNVEPAQKLEYWKVAAELMSGAATLAAPADDPAATRPAAASAAGALAPARRLDAPAVHTRLTGIVPKR